jgi:hypothetical protein
MLNAMATSAAARMAATDDSATEASSTAAAVGAVAGATTARVAETAAAVEDAVAAAAADETISPIPLEEIPSDNDVLDGIIISDIDSILGSENSTDSNGEIEDADTDDDRIPEPAPSPEPVESPPLAPPSADESEINQEEKQSAQESSDEEDEIYECAVCYKQLNMRNNVVTKCGHHYCSKCFYRWIQTNASCPLCRTPITSNAHLTPEQLNNVLSTEYGDYIMLLERLNRVQRQTLKLNDQHLHLSRENSKLFRRQISLRELQQITEVSNEAIISARKDFLQDPVSHYNRFRCIYKNSPKLLYAFINAYEREIERLEKMKIPEKITKLTPQKRKGDQKIIIKRRTKDYVDGGDPKASQPELLQYIRWCDIFQRRDHRALQTAYADLINNNISAEEAAAAGAAAAASIRTTPWPSVAGAAEAAGAASASGAAEAASAPEAASALIWRIEEEEESQNVVII